MLFTLNSLDNLHQILILFLFSVNPVEHPIYTHIHSQWETAHGEGLECGLGARRPELNPPPCRLTVSQVSHLTP